MSSSSANEDDPCSSGEDWIESEKNRNKRRLSTRLSNKPRVILSDAFSSEDDSEDDDFRVKRNGRNKKLKVIPQLPQELEEEEIPIPKHLIPEPNQPDFTATSITSLKSLESYQSGSFVILKTDAENFSLSNPPHIWRIDGKALLQKFEPFTEDGDLKYKNTSVYTGWSSMECDKYTPLKDINIIYNTNNKLVLSFNWSQMKQVVVDSD